MNRPLRRLSLVVVALFSTLLLSTTYIQYVSASTLADNAYNVRTVYKQYERQRGAILVEGEPIVESVATDDTYKFQRVYDNAELYAAVTGYFAVTQNSSTGIEAAEADHLSGLDEDMFASNLMDILEDKQPAGASVELTLNSKAQKAAKKALGKRRGAVVAMDPTTGDIVAMYSSPTYDPNDMASHDSDAVKSAYEKLIEADGDPLFNRTIAGDLYPPGSVFKIVTAAAALESGEYTADSEVEGPATITLPGTSTTLPNDWAGGCADGTPTLVEALRDSCNTGFANLGMAVGEEAIAEQAEAFGFGDEDIDIPMSVTASTFPTDMTEASLAQAAIGQYDVRVTPLQVAMYTAAVANGGVMMKPNLVDEIVDSQGSVVDRPDAEKYSTPISSSTADGLTEMMTAVVEDGTGTAAQISGYTVAGKTGSAQNGDVTTAWFTGFLASGDTPLVVTVAVDSGNHGGVTAAPIAKKVMQAVLNS